MRSSIQCYSESEGSFLLDSDVTEVSPSLWIQLPWLQLPQVNEAANVLDLFRREKHIHMPRSAI